MKIRNVLKEKGVNGRARYRTPKGMAFASEGSLDSPPPLKIGLAEGGKEEKRYITVKVFPQKKSRTTRGALKNFDWKESVRLPIAYGKFYGEKLLRTFGRAVLVVGPACKNPGYQQRPRCRREKE